MHECEHNRVHMNLHECPLCHPELDATSVMLIEHDKLRVIRAASEAEQSFPVFYRVIWRAHVREFSALSVAEQTFCMTVVSEIERVLLEQLQPPPDKMNIASLGNMVPHLHWHIIARHVWDTHWPKPVWAEPVRSAHALTLQAVRAQLPALDAAVKRKVEDALKRLA